MSVFSKAQKPETYEMFNDSNDTELPTFAPVGQVVSYILVTPVGINQAQNLTAMEQEEVAFSPIHISSELNYVHITADKRLADRLIGTKFFNKRLPLLRNIDTNDRNICRVKIEGYVIWVIGGLRNEDVVDSADGVDIVDDPSEPIPHLAIINKNIRNTIGGPIKLFDIENPDFFGSELLAYSRDGSIGAYPPRSILDSFEVVGDFAEILRLTEIRGSDKNYIVYTGDKTNDLVAGLINTVNKTIPVFLNQEEALEHIKKDFFESNFPELVLDENICPIGTPSKISKIQARPFMCSPEFPIYGITNDAKDYGVRFSVNTNRKFYLKMSALRVNGTMANFNINFNRMGLLVQANVANNDIISSVLAIPYNASLPVSITFDYDGLVNSNNKFIESKEYDVKISPEVCKFGVESEVMEVLIRKSDESNFKTVGYFNVHGKSRFTQFCGFSPVSHNPSGINKARTEINNIESQYINKNLSIVSQKQSIHKVMRLRT